MKRSYTARKQRKSDESSSRRRPPITITIPIPFDPPFPLINSKKRCGTIHYLHHPRSSTQVRAFRGLSALRNTTDPQIPDILLCLYRRTSRFQKSIVSSPNEVDRLESRKDSAQRRSLPILLPNTLLIWLLLRGCLPPPNSQPYDKRRVNLCRATSSFDLQYLLPPSLDARHLLNSAFPPRNFFL